MTEKIAKPEIIIHTPFHGSIQGNYFKYDYSLAETENGLYDLFATPVSEMTIDYSRTLDSGVQETFIPFVQKLYKQLRGQI